MERICDDPSTTGVLVQLPLPVQLSEEALAESFHPQKDVDAFHPLNMGRLLMRNRSASMVPCTAMVREISDCIFPDLLVRVPPLSLTTTRLARAPGNFRERASQRRGPAPVCVLSHRREPMGSTSTRAESGGGGLRRWAAAGVYGTAATRGAFAGGQARCCDRQQQRRGHAALVATARRRRRLRPGERCLLSLDSIAESRSAHAVGM